MNLAELQNLDPKNIGSWPAVFRGLVVLILCSLLLGAGFWFDTQHKIAELEKEKSSEGDLKNTFEAKKRKAANLQPLKRQLREMKESFGALLRLLPNKTEMEGLLVDISQSGLASGLEFELFKPLNERKADFYAVQSISIVVTGTYHQFGKFISSVAALPRIVTQHGVKIKPMGVKKSADGKTSTMSLRMNLSAQTYRYLEDDD